MSGGFFRGTSADQDTRFSNKQAKLMKSQKFPPELENLIFIKGEFVGGSDIILNMHQSGELKEKLKDISAQSKPE